MDIVTTERLILRGPLPADWAFLHKHVFSDPEVMGLAFSGRPLSADESKPFFDANFDHARTGKKLGVLMERASARIIGLAGLAECTVLGRRDYEFGFILRQSAWGYGYATEIGRGQIDYGLGELGLDRLLAQVSPQNGASIKALEKIGMTFRSAVHSDERGDRLVYIAQR